MCAVFYRRELIVILYSSVGPVLVFNNYFSSYSCNLSKWKKKRVDEFTQRDARRTSFDISILAYCLFVLQWHHCGCRHCFPLFGLDVLWRPTIYWLSQLYWDIINDGKPTIWTLLSTTLLRYKGTSIYMVRPARSVEIVKQNTNRLACCRCDWKISIKLAILPISTGPTMWMERTIICTL
jgi:hypothetical protein